MSKITRSMNNVSGDITVAGGDVVITDPAKGIVMEDNTGDLDRLKLVDDAGVKTTEVEEV